MAFEKRIEQIVKDVESIGPASFPGRVLNKWVHGVTVRYGCGDVPWKICLVVATTSQSFTEIVGSGPSADVALDVVAKNARAYIRETQARIQFILRTPL